MGRSGQPEMARKPDSKSTHKIEITDEMVEAGIAVFRARDVFDFFDL